MQPPLRILQLCAIVYSIFPRPENVDSLNGIETAIPDTEQSLSAEFFASHRSRLTETTYAQFKKQVEEYLGSDCDKIDEAVVSRTTDWLKALGESEIDLNYSPKPETFSTQDYEADILNGVLANFKSAGIENYKDHDILVTAVADITSLLEKSVTELKEKHEVLAYLLENLSTIVDSDAMKREVVERKIDNVEAMSQSILNSEEVPKLSTRSLFGRREAERQRASWERSKQNLIHPDNLPDTETIILDYLNGAIAYYRRTIYGQRELELNRGFGSDSVEQIDSYQKRYFDSQGGQYNIAMTPVEWINEQVLPFVTDTLYGKSSKVAELLDQQPAWSYTRFSEKKTGFTAGAGAKENGSDYYNSGEPAPSENLNPEQPEPTLEKEKQELFDDIKVLVEKSFPRADKKILIELLESYEGVIKDIDLEHMGARAQLPMERVLELTVRRLHPDLNQQDDSYSKMGEEVCKLAISVRAKFKAKRREDERLRGNQ